MQGEWIRRPQGTAASAVFVHGILSSGETCWLNVNGSYWPELLKTSRNSRRWAFMFSHIKRGFLAVAITSVTLWMP